MQLNLVTESTLEAAVIEKAASLVIQCCSLHSNSRNSTLLPSAKHQSERINTVSSEEAFNSHT